MGPLRSNRMICPAGVSSRRFQYGTHTGRRPATSCAGTPMRILLLFAGAALATALTACSDSSSTPTQASPGGEPAMATSHNAVDGADFGFTDGWLAGQTVSFFYHKPF